MQGLDAEEFARLAEDMFAAAGPTETADQIIEFARAELDGHAGLIMIRSHGQLEVIAATDQAFYDLADNEDLTSGPLWGNDWPAHTLTVPDLAADDRWPDWSRWLTDHGWGSVLAVELTNATDRRIGVLAVMSKQRRRFSSDDIAYAHILARHAALAIAAAEHDAQLNVALDGRKLIGQAQGILMERYGLDDARAFAVLRRYSQDHNIKLREVVSELVASRNLPGDPQR